MNKPSEPNVDAIVTAHRSYFARTFVCSCGREVQPQNGERVVRAVGGYLDGEPMCVECAAEYRLDV